MIEIPHLALSVRQPWAHALVMGWKPVENRSWRKGNPGLAFRGPVAIHASSGMTRAEYEDAADFFADLGFICPPPAELPRGGIVGRATVVDVVDKHESRWFFGPKGLVMAEAHPVEFVPVGGHLGFFDWRRALPPHGKTATAAPPARWMLPDDHGQRATPPRPSGDAPSRQGRLF